MWKELSKIMFKRTFLRKREKEKEMEMGDFGFGSSLSEVGRLILPDGRYNIERVGRKAHTPYQDLVELPWRHFLTYVFMYYILANSFFALLFVFNGVENLSGIETGHSLLGSFIHAFFFSIQTFTTVGYGTISPIGFGANIIASLDALFGLLSFALFTGLLFARFSKPQSSMVFSEKILISPYPKDMTSLQFRIVNRRDTRILDLSATVVMTWLDEEHGQKRRRFAGLELERSSIFLFPFQYYCPPV